MVLPNEVMRSRTVSIPRQICERGDGSRERKHRMQEQHQPKGRYKLCIARPVSSPTHPGAPCSRHTHRSARSCWQQTHTLQARLRQQPSPHRAHLPTEAFGSKSLTHAGHAFGSSLYTPHAFVQQPHTHKRALSLATDGAAGGRSQRVAACRRTE